MKACIWGFVLSIFLTLVAYVLVRGFQEHLFPQLPVVPIILGLGVLQAFIQLVLFLHLGDEPKPRLNLLTFLFMLSVVIIIAVGTIWIMAHLNYNMVMH